MTLDLTFHMLAMNDNCIQNSWLLIAKDFLIIFSLFLIFSHFLSLFIIFYHFKTFFTTLVVIIYIFKILAKLILANLGTKIDVPNLRFHENYAGCLGEIPKRLEHIIRYDY